MRWKAPFNTFPTVPERRGYVQGNPRYHPGRGGYPAACTASSPIPTHQSKGQKHKNMSLKALICSSRTHLVSAQSVQYQGSYGPRNMPPLQIIIVLQSAPDCKKGIVRGLQGFYNPPRIVKTASYVGYMGITINTRL